MRPRYIIEALSLALAVFPRCGDIPSEQLPGNLRRCGSLGSPPKNQTDNISHILVNLHTSVCAFPVSIGANFALVLATLHFCVFSGFCLDRHIPTVALTDKILKGHVNAPGISLEIDGVKIITDRDKPRMVQGKYPLNEISGLNTVTAKAGKVFYHDTVDLTSLNHFQKLLNGRTLKISAAVPVVYKLQNLGPVPLRQ